MNPDGAVVAGFWPTPGHLVRCLAKTLVVAVAGDRAWAEAVVREGDKAADQGERGGADLPRMTCEIFGLVPESLVCQATPALDRGGRTCIISTHARWNLSLSTGERRTVSTQQETNGNYVIAIPVAGDRLCMHFGHCEHFALIDVDTANKQILKTRQVEPPPHEPGVLPRWLHEQGTNLIIAGGMGQRARTIFDANGIEVIVGAPAGEPREIVQSYLDGELASGVNACDH